MVFSCRGSCGVCPSLPCYTYKTNKRDKVQYSLLKAIPTTPQQFWVWIPCLHIGLLLVVFRFLCNCHSCSKLFRACWEAFCQQFWFCFLIEARREKDKSQIPPVSANSGLGNMMVCCTWWTGYQPFSTGLLLSLMVCCTWWTGYQPFSTGLLLSLLVCCTCWKGIKPSSTRFVTKFFFIVYRTKRVVYQSLSKRLVNTL